MSNTETDRLHLVEIVSMQDIVEQTMSATEDFSIEVFRREQHLGSVLSKDTTQGNTKKAIQHLLVQSNDTLYRINLGANLLTITGTFATKDRFMPIYKIVLKIGVVNPTQFILCYRQQLDPIRLVRLALEEESQRYFAQRMQKRLKKKELSYYALHSLKYNKYKNIGVDIIEIQDVEIWVDERSVDEKTRDALTKSLKSLIASEIDNQGLSLSEEQKIRIIKVLTQEAINIGDVALFDAIANLFDAFSWLNLDEPDGYMLDRSLQDLAVEQKEVSQHRYPQARLPERVRVGERLPLQVRIALSPSLDKSMLLRAFSIPQDGVDLKLVLECPSFLLHSTSIATVHVAPTAASDWVLFELEALHEGVHTLEIAAFNGGAFLGTLSLQLTVDSLAVRKRSVDYATLLPLRSPQEGEVTLVIHYDPHSKIYRYQFRGTTFGETDELRSGPLRRGLEEAVADLVVLLNEQARDLTEYSAEETRRWLQGKGVELWKELIPKELENLFWQQRENIKWMTILSAGDPMPWEMMYPTNDAGDDAGFLAEQFPIVRWIFGSAPTAQLQCLHPFFVVPDDAPPTAEDELNALRHIMGDGQNINDLTPLLKMLDHAEFDSLHFACHNVFRADSPTSSSIQLGSKRFTPTFLNKYNKHFHSPLIFMNACRSDGMATNYTWLAGWAKSFLAAGAGAFIGSLWEVRDSSASRFAETFYQVLHSGIPLGDAMKQARMAIQNEPGDPTWLAYTLYGNPTAILLKEAPQVS